MLLFASLPKLQYRRVVPLQLEHRRDVITIHGVEHGLDQALEVHELLVHNRNRRFSRCRAADFKDRVGSEESGALVLRLLSSGRCRGSPVDQQTLSSLLNDDIVWTDVSVNNIQTVSVAQRVHQTASHLAQTHALIKMMSQWRSYRRGQQCKTFVGDCDQVRNASHTLQSPQRLQFNFKTGPPVKRLDELRGAFGTHEDFALYATPEQPTGGHHTAVAICLDLHFDITRALHA
mmetsp:Transcript_89368/g.174910  ORF Transcript_89368/g.174910 Transcript_89368/m.174910 type:complete len:233 (-) Transcript_89368:1033-1731(-)